MMLQDLVELPIQHLRLRWEAKQVLRDLDGKPYLFLRLHLTGAQFPHRALEPFARVGNIRSMFVEIAADEQSANAYFDRSPADDAVVEFGYGQDVLLRFGKRFMAADVKILDRRRLPRSTRNVEQFFGHNQGR